MSRAPETRHLPLPDTDTEAFWEAAADGRLVLQHCLDCHAPWFYPRARCPGCLGDHVEWREASGAGHVHSWTVVHQNHARPFRDRVPYVVVLVTLAEGPRMLGTLEVDDPDAVEIDQPVVVAFRDDQGVHVPVFLPAPS